MKRNLILTALAGCASLMLCTSAQAQSPSPSPSSSPAACPEGNHKKGGMLDHLTNALSLSGSQQAQVAAILQEAKPQMKAIHDEAKAKRTALINSVSSQITPLLTTDQQTKFSQIVQNFENHKGGGKHFARPGGSPPSTQDVLQRMTTNLGLTADQQSQIKPILDAAHAQVQSIHEDKNLAPADKIAKVKDAMQAAHSQINGILTPDQQAKLKEMRPKFHRPEAGQPEATPAPSAS